MLTVVNKLKQLPWITLLCGVAAFILSTLAEQWQSGVQYDRGKILQGEYWRLWTGHLVHWNTPHLVWDLGVFIICAGILEWLRRSLMIATTFVASIAISMGLFLTEPALSFYRGLSGLDMAIFSVLCLQAIGYCRMRKKRALEVSWLLALGIGILKPILEAFLDQSFFVSSFGPGVVASPEAHLHGMVAGISVSVVFYFWRKLSSLPDRNRSFLSHKSSGISIS